LNQQGNDIGTGYRSAVFHTDENERAVPTPPIKEVEVSGLWPGPVVTEDTPATTSDQAPQRLQKPLRSAAMATAARRTRRLREADQALSRARMATAEADSPVGVPRRKPFGHQLVRLPTTSHHKTFGKLYLVTSFNGF
jgi:hypothetical protein